MSGRFRFVVDKVPTDSQGRLLEPELLCPVWICDDCSKPITGQDGYVLWDGDHGPFVVHHLDPNCVSGFEERHGLPHLMSRDLSQVMEQLSFNIANRLEIKK